MVFRASFDCLWCGTPHAVRAADDLEGYAQLCPDCIGKAGDNGFLRFRLKSALAERSAALAGTSAVAQPAPGPAPDDLGPRCRPTTPRERPSTTTGICAAAATAADRGATLAWAADLVAAAAWLDALPMRGEIVELAAGTGWWSTTRAQGRAVGL